MGSRPFSRLRLPRSHGTRVAFNGVKVVTGVLSLACTLHFVLDYVGGPRPMLGPSMLPTLPATLAWCIEESVTVRLFPKPFKRGELIVFNPPYDRSRFVCKRVLGLPGDVVCVDPTGEWAESTEHVVVPQGHLWVIGDNAAMSIDSRFYGPVSMGLVHGRLLCRLWPLSSPVLFRGGSTTLGEI